MDVQWVRVATRAQDFRGCVKTMVLIYQIVAQYQLRTCAGKQHEITGEQPKIEKKQGQFVHKQRQRQKEREGDGEEEKELKGRLKKLKN